MKSILTVKQVIVVGNPVVIESDSPDGCRGVVFEDDGDTGYFYAREYDKDKLFVDALHIYSVAGVLDAETPTELKILWTVDYTKAVLIINQYPHAVLDFINKCGYSRDQYPDPDITTGWVHRPWLNSLRNSFFNSPLKTPLPQR